MNNVINVTKLAQKQLTNMMIGSKSKYILFSVEGGGCNGLKYNLEPNNEEPKKIELNKFYPIGDWENYSDSMEKVLCLVIVIQYELLLLFMLYHLLLFINM